MRLLLGENLNLFERLCREDLSAWGAELTRESRLYESTLAADDAGRNH